MSRHLQRVKYACRRRKIIFSERIISFAALYILIGFGLEIICRENGERRSLLVLTWFNLVFKVSNQAATTRECNYIIFTIGYVIVYHD